MPTSLSSGNLSALRTQSLPRQNSSPVLSKYMEPEDNTVETKAPQAKPPPAAQLFVPSDTSSKPPPSRPPPVQNTIALEPVSKPPPSRPPPSRPPSVQSTIALEPVSKPPPSRPPPSRPPPFPNAFGPPGPFAESSLSPQSDFQRSPSDRSDASSDTSPTVPVRRTPPPRPAVLPRQPPGPGVPSSVTNGISQVSDTKPSTYSRPTVTNEASFQIDSNASSFPTGNNDATQQSPVFPDLSNWRTLEVFLHFFGILYRFFLLLLVMLLAA